MRIGIEYEDGFRDVLDVVWAGGNCMATADEVLEGEAREFALRLQELVRLRYLGATTGAMRWPWSQEFAVKTGRVYAL